MISSNESGSGLNADFVIRKRGGGFYFVPETAKAEEWLISCGYDRPAAEVDKEGRLKASDYKGAVRGAIVDRKAITDMKIAAESAGFIVRREA